MGATFSVVVSRYTVNGSVGELPLSFDALVSHAVLHDDLGLDGSGTAFVLTVQHAAKWPELVVVQRYAPGPEAGFNPAAIVVAETDLLFVGAGTRLLAYDLAAPIRLWEDVAEVGFWGWRRHEDVVLMSAELELAAWDLRGDKLWSTFVEPPWDYEVANGRVILDVIGRRTEFDLRAGPAAGVG
jgi:hypothetical protein